MLRNVSAASFAVFAIGAGALLASSTSLVAGGKDDRSSIVLKDQGSFAYGGTVITGTDGNTFHGDHGYAQYQIPQNARKYPIVMWHGGGQFSKTWETTPDGRDGYQNILLRNGYATYIIDQPRRGRAGRSTVGTTIPNGAPGESNTFNIFRLGTWLPPDPPVFFPNVQFPRDSASLDQYWRQQTSNTGPEGGRDFQQAAGVALMDKVGPAILMTHSNSGQYGWRVAMHSSNVRAIISYEPASWSFPVSAPPADIPTDNPQVAGLSAPDLVPDSDFNKLTKIPIQIIYGDNIEFNTPSPIFGVELWRVVVQRAQQFVDEINSRGGNAQLLFLPKAGLRGNTHFPFSDLNNKKVADLLFKYLKREHLDGYDRHRRRYADRH